MTRIVCMSDLHCRRPANVPEGDVLVVAGDWCGLGTVDELRRSAWVADLPHKHKVAIAGNHDWCFQRKPDSDEARFVLTDWGVTYLEEGAAEIMGLKFYGSPWQPEFCNWAFNLPRGHRLREKWAQIPEDTEVLITHGPPRNILDLAPRSSGAWGWDDVEGEHVGCWDLRARVLELPHLKLHVFGHIHHSYGQSSFGGALKFVNASTCTERYAPDNAPIVIDL